MAQKHLVDPPFTEQKKLRRVIDKDAPRLAYDATAGLGVALHHGQRKLLVSEIGFLTRFATNETVVVYAGAAPGTHIPMLVSMFAAVPLWILVDPAPFKIDAASNIVLVQDRFTDESAKELAARYKSILFISDIRSAGAVPDKRKMSKKRFNKLNAKREGGIEADMADQARWVGILKPKAALLKFRLPFTPGKTRYLDGELAYQAWAPQLSAEARLTVVAEDKGRTKEYDHTTHEQRMFYFNAVTRRECIFPHGVKGDYCQCYDCSAEIVVLQAYLARVNDKEPPTGEAIAVWGQLITKSLSK